MVLLLLLLIPGFLQAQDAKTVLADAAKAMGAENLRTIQVTGSGSNAGIGQGTEFWGQTPNCRCLSPEFCPRIYLIVLRVQGFVFFMLLVAPDGVCLFARLGEMCFPGGLGAHRA